MLQKSKSTNVSAKQETRSARRSAKKEKRQRAKELRAQKKKLDKSNTDTAKKVKRLRAPRSASECLALEQMYENGICEIEPGLWSMTLRFTDVNYQIARREDQANTFSRWCELLNYCDPSMHMQVSMITQHIDQHLFESSAFIPAAGDALDKYRQEMNRVIADKALEGQNGLLREKYMTVTIRAQDYDAAHKQLLRRKTEIQKQMKGLRSTAVMLSGKQRLQIINGILRPGIPLAFDYDWLLTEGSLRAKDFIAPDSFDWRPEHDDSRAVYNDRYRFGGLVGKTVYLRDIAPEMTDDLLSRLNDLPFDLAIAIHIDAYDQLDATELVRTKLAYMNQEASDGIIKANKQGLPAELGVRFELQQDIENAKNLLDDLQNRNQKLFRVAIMVHTYGNTNEELDARVAQICSTVEKKTCRFSPLEFQQQAALNSILPIGEKRIGLERTMTTANAAIFIPFTTEELFEQGGTYEGLNARSNNLILLRRKDLDSPAGFVLGQPGSGKSLAVKREISNVLMRWPDDDVIVIDPEGEYTPMGENFAGQVIEISTSSASHINPLDITEYYADKDDPLTLKSQFLMSFCELIAGGEGITASERTYIDRATRLTYQKFFAHPEKMEMPTLKDFHDNLLRQGVGAQELAVALGIYVDGTLDVFAHQTNVDAQNRFIIYNTVRLGKPLQTLGMMVVLDQIWNRITMNRRFGRRTWIYTDEFQLLLRDPLCTNFYFELSGRSRKWGAILTSITQHIDSVLMSEDARRMLSDCQYVKLLNQSRLDAQQLGQILKISPDELDYIVDVDPGCGLLIAGTTVVPFIDDFPKDTALFTMMDTNPNTKKAMPRR